MLNRSMRLAPTVAKLFKTLERVFDSPSGRSPVVICVVGLMFLITFVWGWCLLHAGLGVGFTQDSFGYYLLGNNLFNGLGYTSFSARDLSVTPSWPVPSRSFPPLHPIFVGMMDVLTGLRIRSASVVSLLYLTGGMVMTFALGMLLKKRAWLFLFFAFVVFLGANPYYREELTGGRSIPGMMLFFLLAVFFFLKSVSSNRRTWRYEILSGVMLSATLLMRFDQTLFCLLFLLLSFAVFRLGGDSFKKSLIRTGTIAAALVIAYLPWAIRNIIVFGVPFASDNTGSTSTTFTGLYCSSFWLPGKEPPNLFTHPSIWLDQRLGFLKGNFFRIVEITDYIIYGVPVAVALMWRTFSFRQKVFIAIAGIHFITTLVTISLTPYHDHRYFSLVHLNVVIVAALCIANGFTALAAGRCAGAPFGPAPHAHRSRLFAALGQSSHPHREGFARRAAHSTGSPSKPGGVRSVGSRCSEVHG